LNIVWLKRDLRTKDNLPLFNASKDNCLVIYIFEPSVSNNYDFDLRHWRFVYQSLKDLEAKGFAVHKFYAEAIDVFGRLKEIYGNISIFSHRETGNDLSYKRDLTVKAFSQSNAIDWFEYTPYGVMRGVENRQGWDHHWLRYVKEQIRDIANFKNILFNLDLQNEFLPPIDLQEKLKEINPLILSGGESRGVQYLKDFLDMKVEEYCGAISYPEKNLYYCSRLSAYISWGNLSIRQIYQACELKRGGGKNTISLNQYMVRLKWHCHFIQRLESQPEIEFENVNPAYNNIRKNKNKKFIKAWKYGMTGYPLIDAAMRCVQVTGYLNFRLRATVVSFLTHTLWQPWQAGSGHLARAFLDYEPGIHFSQFQMQAGTTGINTLRIYNPVKQSKEKDKDAIFIKKWLPELKDIPLKFIHEPWLLSSMDEILYNFKLGEDYPKPIVDFEKENRYARDQLWIIKNSNESKFQSRGILLKHARKKNRKRKGK
jgi:deoxyribodipyrimidine photo-lyase